MPRLACSLLAVLTTSACAAELPDSQEDGACVDSFPRLQLAGCNTDCGRVEVNVPSPPRGGEADSSGGESFEWRYLCASKWTLQEADVVCRSLGFESAFAAFPNFGGAGKAARPWAADVVCPSPNVSHFQDCNFTLSEDSSDDGEVPVCSQAQAVGVACRAAGASGADAEFAPLAHDAVGRWNAESAHRKLDTYAYFGPMRTATAEATKDSPGSSCAIDPAVPRPWTVENARAAFVFSELVEQDYAAMDAELTSQLCDPTPVSSFRVAGSSDAGCAGEVFTPEGGSLEYASDTDLTRGQLLQRTLVDIARRGLRWNALGMDLTGVRPRRQSDRHQDLRCLRQELDLVLELYLHHNPHALLHNQLDQPLRQRASSPLNAGADAADHNNHSTVCPEGGRSKSGCRDSTASAASTTTTNSMANRVQVWGLEQLQRDGFLPVPDFGLSTDELDHLANVSATIFTGSSGGVGGGGADTPDDHAMLATMGISVSATSGGLVSTARMPLPAVEALLFGTTLGTDAANNVGEVGREESNGTRFSLRRLVNGYLGPSLLDGYKITRLATETIDDEKSYVASRWHHDRSGRRLKAFIYLHDCECEGGHPTQVALGTHNLLYYRTDSLHATRFRDNYVRGYGHRTGNNGSDHGFDIALGCGKRGGGFIFDTHTVHKGTPEGTIPRTTVILEFHNQLKCAAVRALGLPLPCPSGDQFMRQLKIPEEPSTHT